MTQTQNYTVAVTLHVNVNSDTESHALVTALLRCENASTFIERSSEVNAAHVVSVQVAR